MYFECIYRIKYPQNTFNENKIQLLYEKIINNYESNF